MSGLTYHVSHLGFPQVENYEDLKRRWNWSDLCFMYVIQTDGHRVNLHKRELRLEVR